jgi:hypothetical protein
MPSWVADHDIWSKAKQTAKKQDIDKSSDSFYAIVSTIYKKMGGRIKRSKKHVGIYKAIIWFPIKKAWIKGHYKTSRQGNKYWVQPHNDKRDHVQREPEISADDDVYLRKTESPLYDMERKESYVGGLRWATDIDNIKELFGDDYKEREGEVIQNPGAPQIRLSRLKSGDFVLSYDGLCVDKPRLTVEDIAEMESDEIIDSFKYDKGGMAVQNRATQLMVFTGERIGEDDDGMPVVIPKTLIKVIDLKSKKAKDYVDLEKIKRNLVEKSEHDKQDKQETVNSDKQIERNRILEKINQLDNERDDTIDEFNNKKSEYVSLQNRALGNGDMGEYFSFNARLENLKKEHEARVREIRKKRDSIISEYEKAIK